MSPEKRSEAFRHLMYTFPIKLLERLETDKEDLKNVNASSLSEDDKIQQAQLASLNNIIEEIQTNIVTARTVKNFFKSIKRNIRKLDAEIKRSNAEPLKENWFQAIMEVQFLKYFSPVAFFRLQMSGSILEYGRSEDNYGLITALGLRPDSINNNDNRCIVLNYLISKIDAIDIEQLKTHKDAYLSELYSDGAVLEHMDEYLRYARKSEDLCKILDVCRIHNFADDIEKESIIGQVLDAVAQIRSPLRSNSGCFLLFSKRFVRYVKELGLTTILREKVVDAGSNIVKHILTDNLQSFGCILTIVFRFTDVYECIDKENLQNMDDFYALLVKLDQNNKYSKDIDEEHIIVSIKKYFTNIENEVMDIDDEEIKEDFLNMIRNAQEALDVCAFWSHVIDELRDGQEKVFRKYFYADKTYECKRTVFKSAGNMKEALSELYHFYALHREDYNSKYSLMLQRISMEFIQMYEKNNVGNMFEGQEKEICELLDKAAKMVYQTDQGLSREARDTVDQIRVYVYRFRCYVKGNG